MSNKEELTIGRGCVGICAASVGEGGKAAEQGYPEEGKGVECWAGAEGEKLALEAGKRKCGRTPVIVFSKRGKWAEWAKDTKGGDKIKPMREDGGRAVVGFEGEDMWDYITRLGNFYVDAEMHLWKQTPGPVSKDNLIRDKKMIQICRKPPDKGGYPAEIWCYRCCGGRTIGYREGYQ